MSSSAALTAIIIIIIKHATSAYFGPKGSDLLFKAAHFPLVLARLACPPMCPRADSNALANKCDDDSAAQYVPLPCLNITVTHSSDMAPRHLRSGGSYIVVTYK